MKGFCCKSSSIFPEVSCPAQQCFHSAAHSNVRLPPTPALSFTTKIQGGGTGGRETVEQALLSEGTPQTSLILGPKPRAPLQFFAQTPGWVLYPTINLSVSCVHANASAWPSTTAGHSSFFQEVLLLKLPVSVRPNNLCWGPPSGQGLGPLGRKGVEGLTGGVNSLELSGGRRRTKSHIRDIQTRLEGPVC